MIINKSHPLYQEYIGKAKKIGEQLKEEWDSLEITGGKDGLSSKITKKYSDKLNTLKQEYYFLFTEE